MLHGAAAMPRSLRAVFASLFASLPIALDAGAARADVQPSCPDPLPSEAAPEAEKEAAKAEPSAPPPSAKNTGLRADFGFHFVGGEAALQGRSLDNAPAYKAARLRFGRDGTLLGGALGITAVHENGVRIGVVGTFFGLSRTSFSYAPLDAFAFSMGQPWGLEVELTGGYALHLGPLMPFLDLRVGVGFAAAEIQARSAELGSTVSLGRRAVTPVLSPRLGLQVHVFGPLAIELSGSASPIGIERYTGSAGIVLRAQ